MKWLALFAGIVLFGLGLFFWLRPAPMPSEVKSGPFTFKVEQNQTIWKLGYLGLTFCDSQLIVIAKDISRDKAKEVLVHELAHVAMCGHGELKKAPVGDDLESLFKKAEPTYTEEEFIYVSSPHLMAILKDNPQVLAFLSQ